MDVMTECLLNPTSSLETYGKHVRNFCIKVGAACVPIAAVSKHILAWISISILIKPNEDLYVNVLHVLASMEHATKCVSKPLFALEHNIDLVLQMIVKA